MDNAYQAHANDLNDLMAELGDTFSWNAGQGVKQWGIVPGTASFNRPLREGGFSHIYDLSFTTTVGQFIGPQIADAVALQKALLPNQRIVYLGITYRPNNVHILAGATLIKVEAVSMNQNA